MYFFGLMQRRLSSPKCVVRYSNQGLSKTRYPMQIVLFASVIKVMFAVHVLIGDEAFPPRLTAGKSVFGVSHVTLVTLGLRIMK